MAGMKLITVSRITICTGSELTFRLARLESAAFSGAALTKRGKARAKMAARGAERQILLNAVGLTSAAMFPKASPFRRHLQLANPAFQALPSDLQRRDRDPAGSLDLLAAHRPPNAAPMPQTKREGRHHRTLAA